ncbi:MAG: tRNA preQ1(34) S-adenosylmethionine ribosyltransferase-isomerase QueA, partial [Caulobacteraceae bacterium]
MRLSDFDFDLPEERIALRPAQPRDAARLMVVSETGALDDRRMADLPLLVRAGDALVFNDTRVIAARLKGVRRREGSAVAVEVTLLKRLDDWRWEALAKPGRRLAAGDVIEFGETSDRACLLSSLAAKVAAKHEDGSLTLAFELAGPDLDLAIAERGAMPLPPYIASRRAEDEQDRADYQTVYAREDGSVAAPTAGLHFTPELMEALEAAGVRLVFVTLHVGAGTFLPVKTEEVAEHRMHAEAGVISAEAAGALNAARAGGGRIVAVGTTALRLLETAADEAGRIRPFAGETSIFITPGYRFRTAQVL